MWFALAHCGGSRSGSTLPEIHARSADVRGLVPSHPGEFCDGRPAGALRSVHHAGQRAQDDAAKLRDLFRTREIEVADQIVLETLPAYFRGAERAGSAGNGSYALLVRMNNHRRDFDP
jgi:hypothetical protein